MTLPRSGGLRPTALCVNKSSLWSFTMVISPSPAAVCNKIRFPVALTLFRAPLLKTTCIPWFCEVFVGLGVHVKFRRIIVLSGYCAQTGLQTLLLTWRTGKRLFLKTPWVRCGEPEWVNRQMLREKQLSTRMIKIRIEERFSFQSLPNLLLGSLPSLAE